MKRITTVLLATLMAITTYPQSAVKNQQLNLEKGIAIQGYDPTSYFLQSKAVKGSRDIAATVEGVTYYFASANNKELFLKAPKNYEPQYGGWCAYAMGSTGEKVEIDPQTFKIIQGKLYLFYRNWVYNSLPKWNDDEHNLKVKADKNWQKVNYSFQSSK